MRQHQKLLWGLLILTGLTSYGYFLTSPQKSAPGGQEEGYPLKLVDSYQREVTLDREPVRVVSVAPNITEILYVLNKEKLLVGRTDYCDYPAAARRVTSIGSMTDPSIETIVGLKPDLVIASTHFQKAVLEKLEDLGIKVAVFYGAESFEGVFNVIRQVGNALNARKEAAAVVAAMQQKVKQVTLKVKDAPKPKVYYVVGFGRSGDYTAGKDTFIGNMIEMAGGVNIADDIKGWQYSLEELVEKDPDLLICSRYFNAKTGIEHATGYRDLPAVKAGRLYEIDNNLLDRQGPRAADGLVALARVLHPEIFRISNKEQK